jgi:hypothetical protein
VDWVKWGSSRKVHNSRRAGAFEHSGQYGTVSFHWAQQDPLRLVAVKTIQPTAEEEEEDGGDWEEEGGGDEGEECGKATAADLERLHRRGIPDQMQQQTPGLLRLHGSFLERDEHGIRALRIVSEPLVGRWCNLELAFRDLRVERSPVDSNIFLQAGRPCLPLRWWNHSAPGAFYKALWDSMLRTLLGIEGRGRFYRDSKPSNLMVDVLSCAAEYGEDTFPAAVLQEQRGRYQWLLEQLEDPDAAAGAGPSPAAAAVAPAAGHSYTPPAAGTAGPASSSAAAAAAVSTADAAAEARAVEAGVRGPGDMVVSPGGLRVVLAVCGHVQGFNCDSAA